MLKVKTGVPVHCEITVPGDKSISHRALMISALSNGLCKITNFLPGEDCLATAQALRKLGVQIEFLPDNFVAVEGCHGKFNMPDNDIDCGNSGTTMRLLAGILATQPFRSRLVGDASLSRRPMDRVIQPLSLMGARLFAEGEKKGCPPLVIEGGKLNPITYHTPVASAQIKSAILLASLFTRGKTTIIEPNCSRDHTERMLQHFLVPIQREGLQISLQGPSLPESGDFHVPGDISSAAYWLVAAAAQPNSHLLIREVGLNPTRTGIIGVLIRMGARICEVVEQTAAGEPSGTLDITGGPLRGTVIEGEEIPNVIDEIPILAVAGALAKGKTIIRDAQELRVKETDRIAAIVTNLRAMGIDVVEREDGMEIQGQRPLQGAQLNSFGDHRIAMAFAIAGLFARGKTSIEDTDCIRTSYPGFEKILSLFQKGNGVLQHLTPVIRSLNSKQH